MRRVLGHKNLQTTINFYIGLEAVDAVRKFSAIALEGVDWKPQAMTEATAEARPHGRRDPLRAWSPRRSRRPGRPRKKQRACWMTVVWPAISVRAHVEDLTQTLCLLPLLPRASREA